MPGSFQNGQSRYLWGKKGEIATVWQEKEFLWGSGWGVGGSGGEEVDAVACGREESAQLHGQDSSE